MNDPEILGESMKAFIVLGLAVGVAVFMASALEEARDLSKDLPQYSFNNNAAHDIMTADCIAGNKTASFSREKLDELTSSGSNVVAIPCFRDASIEYRVKIASDTAPGDPEWEFKSAGFDAQDYGLSDDLTSPRSAFSRAITIEQDGRYYRGTAIIYLVTAEDIECFVDNGDGTTTPC